LGIREGRRCALGLWFTKQQDHQEMERFLAIEVVKQIKLRGNVSKMLIDELESILN